MLPERDRTPSGARTAGPPSAASRGERPEPGQPVIACSLRGPTGSIRPSAAPRGTIRAVTTSTASASPGRSGPQAPPTRPAPRGAWAGRHPGRGQALVLAGKVRVGDGDGARLDHKPGDLVARDIADRHRCARALRQPRRAQARRRARRVRDRPGRPGRPRRRGLDGRLHGRPPPARRPARLRRRRGSWPARRVAAARPAGDVDGADERADPDRRRRSRSRSTSSSIDVSFISLGQVLGPVATTLSAPAAPIVALVKPQFEAGKGRHGPWRRARSGDPSRGARARGRRRRRALGLGTRDVIASPILGSGGQPRVPAPPRAGSGLRRDRRADRRGRRPPRRRRSTP